MNETQWLGGRVAVGAVATIVLAAGLATAVPAGALPPGCVSRGLFLPPDCTNRPPAPPELLPYDPVNNPAGYPWRRLVGLNEEFVIWCPPDCP